MKPLTPRHVARLTREQKTKRPLGHEWQPLQGLSATALQHDFSRIEAWKKRWDAFRARPDVQARLRVGVQRLERLWSIETGLLEGLYTLNRGAVKTLLAHGFVPNVVRAQDTNIDPERLVTILSDHQTSVELVHGYCPPEQVDSEIERLRDLYEVYDDQENVHPLLCAAWLHHRFVQIHPFAGGRPTCMRWAGPMAGIWRRSSSFCCARRATWCMRWCGTRTLPWPSWALRESLETISGTTTRAGAGDLPQLAAGLATPPLPDPPITGLNRQSLSLQHG